MTKRATAFLLALLMVAQVLVPGAARAQKASLPYPKLDKELVEVGKVEGKDYPKLTNKVILDIQKQATKNSRKHLQKNPEQRRLTLRISPDKTFRIKISRELSGKYLQNLKQKV